MKELKPEIQCLCVGYFHHKRDLPEIVDALDAYVSSGGAFLALHGVSASFKGNTRFESLLGGVFTRHDSIQELGINCSQDGPARSPVATTVVDEPYEHRVLDETQVICRWQKSRVHETGEASLEPCAWHREYGAGRVGYLSLGHRSGVWDDSGVRSILHDLIRWCNTGGAR
jgi:uncharacterized protein